MILKVTEGNFLKIFFHQLSKTHSYVFLGYQCPGAAITNYQELGLRCQKFVIPQS